MISANIFRDTFPGPVVNNPGPTSEPTPIDTFEPQSPLPNANPSPASAAATCKISGTIKYLEENIYETIDAKIVYQNVNDKISQIYWKSNPDDSVLKVGPNLFEELVIPNGEREIAVVLNGQPTVSEYILTSSITYGVRNAQGVIETKIANCSGTIRVDVSNI